MSIRDEDRFILSLLFISEESKSPNNVLKYPGPGSTALSGKISDHFNWNYILETLNKEGISEVLNLNIKMYRLYDCIPKIIYENLADQYYNNLRKYMSIISALKALLTLFKEHQIPCLMLKGIALAELIYPGIALRGMSDIDILVKKDDLYAIDDLLSSQGYISRDSSVSRAIHNPEGYLASLEYRKDDASILNLHVHWHMVNTSVPATMFIKQVNIDRIWEKALTAKVADVEVLTLCPEHLVIYLCEHALRVGHSFDRLILLCDIYYAIKTYVNNFDWNFMIEESRRFNLDRFVFFGLSIVKHYSSLNIPDEYLRRLKPDNISLGEKLFLHLQYNNRRIRGSSYFIYLAMNRNLSDKFSFLFRTFFPPAPILLQRQRIRDARSLKSYYLYRICEVFSQTAKIFLHYHKKTLKYP